jgi:flavin-dependent dehydrogenase
VAVDDDERGRAMSAIVDVAVVGGGPAGVAAALGCARRGLEVALLDRARFPRDKPCGEGLLPTAVSALHRLGVYSRVRPHAIPLEGIRFAVPSGPEAAAHFCNAGGDPALGLGVTRRLLDAELVAAARAEPGVTVLEGVDARAPLVSGARVSGVQTTAGVIRSRVVIACDGLRSSFRLQLGLGRATRAPERIGLRAHFAVPSLPFGRSVWVLIGPALEYYVTPVGVAELQVAVLGPKRAFARVGLNAGTFGAHVLAAPALGPALAGARLLDRPLGAGPFAQRVRALAVDGALLAGDAAGYLDAITGEGVGLALDTGSAAANAAADAIAGGDVRATALAPYVRAHAAIVRDAERLTRVVLALSRSPFLARRAIGALHRSPRLFRTLLRVQAGAPLSSVPLTDWARLVAG